MKSLLLDTNALVFCVAEPRKLSRKAKAAIRQADALFVSVASLWEIAIKSSKGKMPEGARAYHRAANELGVQILSIEADDIHALELLDDFPHSDPFDRIIAACSKRRLLPLLTSDQHIRRSLNSAIW